MKPNSPRLLTGIDYRISGLGSRSRRRLRILLSLVAISAFGSAWLIREEASAAAEAAALAESMPQSVAAADQATSAAPTSPFAVVSATPDPAPATSAASAMPSVPETLKPASAAVQAAVAAAPTSDEAVVDAITEELEEKPGRKQLTLPAGLKLRSSVVLVVDQNTHEVLAGQNIDAVRPIASLTKLMTALVVTDARQPLDEVLEITREDFDTEKHSYSRLTAGMKFTREEMLILALMSSENRAASALGRNYPGGRAAFIKAMNAKARALGMSRTAFGDSTGLSSRNVSTAQDLAKLVEAAYKVRLIREFSTQTEHTVKPTKRRQLHFVSSNRLVRAKNDWRIGLQKTGFTNEAGRCLVMQATVKGRQIIMVLLDSDGKLTRFADAQRLRQWIESGRNTASAKAQSKSKAKAKAGTS